MAQELLYASQVRSPGKQLSRIGVSHGVWRDASVETGDSRLSFEPASKRSCRHTVATRRHKEGIRPLSALLSGNKQGSDVPHILGDSRKGFVIERYDALLGSLAKQPDLSLAIVDITYVKLRYL